MSQLLIRLTALAVLALGLPAAAHHSRPAAYLLDQRIVLEGVMTELFWRNPHPFLFIEVDRDGEVETWAAEMAPTIWMNNQGYTKDSIKVGDRIMLIGSPARRGKKIITFDGVYRASDDWVYGADPRLFEESD